MRYLLIFFLFAPARTKEIRTSNFPLLRRDHNHLSYFLKQYFFKKKKKKKEWLTRLVDTVWKGVAGGDATVQRQRLRQHVLIFHIR
jgi:hypothetical protein